jgi:SAM-dependent methyltransferase
LGVVQIAELMERNIPYQTDQLARYFVHNRVAWEQFYESERVVIEGLQLDSSRTILDIGCGCGGLGLALRAQFGVETYTGVEINPLAADAGRSLNPGARILCGDILDLRQGELREHQFDVVFSLSCVDWNVRFDETLAAAWSFVAPGGYLAATFRLTEGEGCNDIARSYQYINFEGKCEGERASYVVNGARELMQKLESFRPSEIAAYGYWGAPSATAVTPYARLCFAAFSIRKRVDSAASCRIELRLPESIRNRMEA